MSIKTLIIPLFLFGISLIINVFANVLENYLEKKKKKAIDNNNYIDNEKNN